MDDKLWLEFVAENACDLCSNKGIIRGKHKSHFCICPNGRQIKLKEAWHDRKLINAWHDPKHGTRNVNNDDS